MEIKINGETLILKLAFAGIENVTKYYEDILYIDEAYDRNKTAMLFKLNAFTKTGKNVIKCYGTINNEAVIEDRYGSLNPYLDYLYARANADKKVGKARIDELRSLDVLIMLSDQYRTTKNDPEFMAHKPANNDSCIIFVDKFIIAKEERNKKYGKAIWSAFEDLFAEYGIAIRYITTIVCPLNLDNLDEWHQGIQKYDMMYRVMAKTIEDLGFVPLAYNVMLWPGIVHLKQFNSQLPVTEEHAWSYNRDEHRIYAEIMNL